MKHSIHYVPRAHVTFTREEVDVLYECAIAHYDWTCKALARPGKGAIINGLRVELGYGSNSVLDIEASYDLWSCDVDLLCKVLEQASLVYLNHPEPMATAAALMMSLGRLFHELNRPREESEYGHSDSTTV